MTIYSKKKKKKSEWQCNDVSMKTNYDNIQKKSDMSTISETEFENDNKQWTEE